MNNSILLISSQDPKNKKMGTGFVVYQDNGVSYVLTCNHVLKAVMNPKIDDYEIEVVVQNELYDMALLKVTGLERKPLRLQEKNHLNNEDVYFYGYRYFKQGENRANRRNSTILTLGKHESGEISFAVWEIVAKENNKVKQGYSGSPLIFNGNVIGMMTNRETSEVGYAIHIKHLKDVWKDMPLPLRLKQTNQNPFVGLRAFRKEDIKHFFGREKEIAEIISQLEEKHFLAVVGDSGSGKSSVIKAGIIPFYENKGYAIVEMRPANDPFIEFKSEIGKLAKGLEYSNSDITNFKREISLDKSFENIRSILEQIFQEKHKVVVFYIDQFEELFTSYSDKSEENQKKFLGLLLYLSHNQSSQLSIKIIFTMRSDYYPLLKKHEIIEHIEENNEANKYIIKRMKDDELKETIYKPLLAVDLVNEQEAKAFAEFVVKGMGSKDNEITLLQIAMTQTYNHFDESKDLFDAYRKIGSVSGALQELATNTMEAIDNKELLKTIFIRLIHFDKDKHNHTRRVAEKSEFSSEQWTLIQSLSSALSRLLKLSKENENSNQTVELVHEALITGWSKYNDWIGEVEYFKPLHDVVIAKTKAYKLSNKKHDFLLMGADLDESKSLLSKQYMDFLSEDEKVYLMESKKFEDEEKRKQRELIESLTIEQSKNRKSIKYLIVLLFFLGGIGGLSWYLKIETDKSKDKIVTILTNIINRASIALQENDISVVEDIVLDTIKELDESSKDTKVQRVLSQAWFIQGYTLDRNRKDKEALYAYNKLIKFFVKSKDIKVLRYVAKSLHNKGRIFYDMNKSEKGREVYDDLIKNFQNTEDKVVLYEVAKAWYRKGAEVGDTEQLKVFLDFVTFFKDSRNILILKEVGKGNAGIGWSKLLSKEYDESIKFTKKGLNIDNDGFWMEINLAHAYLLRNKTDDIDNAKIIYLKYKNNRKHILDDFEILKKYGLKTDSYQYIDNYLLMHNK